MLLRRAGLGAACLLALGATGGALCAQTNTALEIVGEWKGLLHIGATKLRLVLHIQKADAALTGSLDSLDQGALGLPIDTIRAGDGRLHFEMTRLGAEFDGKWNVSTQQFEGEWAQGPARFSLAWARLPERAAHETPLSGEDRQYLVDYLQRTEDGVLQSISHLTPAQWTFKPDASRWSIAECVEHLVMEEQTMFRTVTKTVVNVPLPEGQVRAGREQDRRIIAAMTDRSQKFSAAEAMRPAGKLATVEEGVAQFSKIRRGTIEWVRTSAVDLRAHGTANPMFQFLDAYGYWIVLAAHSARHTAQMEEVKSAPGYPR